MERSHSLMVVFDLGGVLVAPEGSITNLAQALDVSMEELAAAYWRFRDAYDRGGSLQEFWGSVTAQLGRSADPDDLDRIDTAKWSSITPGTAQLLADLDAAGAALGVLSNAPASLAAVVREADWSTAFQTLIFSSDVAVMKPEPAIYRAAQERFGVAGDRLLFFDDRPVNVEGARQVGWAAQVWTDLGTARRALVRAGVLDG